MICRSALSAYQNIGQGIFARILPQFRPCLCGAFLDRTTLRKLLLNTVICITVDNGRVAVVNDVLVPFAVVLDTLVGDAVNGLALLENGITCVFLIFEDKIHIHPVPC